VRFGTLSEGLHTNCTAHSKHASCGTSGGTLGLVKAPWGLANQPIARLRVAPERLSCAAVILIRRPHQRFVML